jgi:precorrin-2 dehydrogenase / sirohydrochlorin ferrochelatase
MMTYLPIALDIREKSIVLIGGGNVALHKLKTLTQFSKNITIIAPEVLPVIEGMDVAIIKREYADSDLDDIFLVYACTNNKKLNKQIRDDAKVRNVLINVVDDSSLSDFISPAVFQSEEAIVAVYTDGKKPVLSRDIKNFLKDRWNDFLSYRNKL